MADLALILGISRFPESPHDILYPSLHRRIDARRSASSFPYIIFILSAIVQSSISPCTRARLRPSPSPSSFSAFFLRVVSLVIVLIILVVFIIVVFFLCWILVGRRNFTEERKFCLFLFDDVLFYEFLELFFKYTLYSG